ncbi:MAG TPA: DUF5666 domain-containing protein, partial [Blastocatellia bacterium]|nr:DUF5666 domain-containing protein [Blastocatellia bacterium]
VADKVVHVSQSTRIKQEKGPIRVGAFVEVKGIFQADRSIAATEVETKSQSTAASSSGGLVSGGSGNGSGATAGGNR